jgi:ribonucleoside-diphosphate reductase beta chain
MSNIFEHRESVQPYEYEHLLKYADAIHESFWIPKHFTYDRDVREFRSNLTEIEKEVVKRSMLSIGVVENKVKTFWARIDNRMPKVEISDVGHTFGGNEVIHRRAYELLLNLLGLGGEFEKVLEVECMRDRAKYLTKYLQGITSRSNKEFTKSLILFTLLVENCSLFSQFLILASFNKYKNLLNNFNSVVCATGREEVLHGQFGAELIKIIREENPEWFDQEMEDKVRRSIRKAFQAEVGVLNWIFEEGELEFLPKDVVIEYLKSRFNLSLTMIGYEPEYEVDEGLLDRTKFFDRTVKSSISFDFFNEKSSEYAQADKITEDDWDL